MKKILLILLFWQLSLWGTEFSKCKHFIERTMFGIDKTNLTSCLHSSNYEEYVHTLINRTHTTTSDNTSHYDPQILRPSRKMKNLSIPERKAFQKKRRESYMALKVWWFNKMLTTDDPFLEHMVLFWHKHFTSSLRKVGQASLLYKQNQLFRKHALGNFSKLLHAIVEDPAMLIYLDNRANRKNHPNENLARELLELFTMGEGNYKESDIKALARALTGYSLDKNLHFRFKKRIHDKGSKEIFGQRGNFNAHDVINIILEQPATSTFIVRKLWLEFIGSAPDTKEIEKLARLFVQKNYEIKPLIEAIFTSKAFTDPSQYGTMVKSPVELAAGTLRSFEYDDFDTKTAVQFCKRLGQDLFDPPNVKGWADGDQWINTNTLLIRKAFLNRLTRGDAMQHLGYDLLTPVRDKQSREERAAETLLPTNVFITPEPKFSQTIRMILQNPLYQLK